MKYKRSLEDILESKRFLFLLLFTALLVRVLWLDRYPAGLQQDEAFAGWFAYALGEYGIDNFGYGNPIYFTAWGSGMNALYSYLSIPFVKLLGLNVYAIRLPQALFAFLGILAFYGILKRTMNQKIAVLGVFFMTINPWHITMCRWGLESALVPTFFLFSTYFFIRGLEKKPWLLLSGLFYGLTLYCYATFWLILPFVLLFQLVYGFRCKKLTFDRYLIGFIGILGITAVPLFLFLAVNYGWIPEITTRFLSIPKMAYYRGGEFAFENIGQNILLFLKAFFRQEDDCIWNAVPGFGFYYLFSWPFILIGLVVSVKNTIRAWKEKTFYLPAIFLFMFVVFLLEIMVLKSGEMNKVNTMHLSVILFCILGFYECLKYLGGRITFVFMILYLVSFGMFLYEYTHDYNISVSDAFQEGAVEAIEYASGLTEGEIGVDYNIRYPKMMFATKMDAYTATNTTVYYNYPNKFLHAIKIANFTVYTHLDDCVNDCQVLVWTNDEESKAYLSRSGYEIREFTHFLVAYQ